MSRESERAAFIGIIGMFAFSAIGMAVAAWQSLDFLNMVGLSFSAGAAFLILWALLALNGKLDRVIT